MINDGRRDPIVSIEHIVLATQDSSGWSISTSDIAVRHQVRRRSPERPRGVAEDKHGRHFLSANGDAGTVPGVVGRPYRDVRERTCRCSSSRCLSATPRGTRRSIPLITSRSPKRLLSSWVSITSDVL